MTDPGLPMAGAPSFFEGQRLTATDLNSATSQGTALRWLHNRSLHDWGIATGLAVTAGSDGRSVIVQPGYAVDRYGRELIVTTTQEIAVPAAGGAGTSPVSYFLTATYTPPATAESRGGVCDTAGPVWLSGEATLGWRTADPQLVHSGESVVLAGVDIRDCRLDSGISLAPRRDAMPSRQPFVAAGQTDPGSTGWQLLFTADQAPYGIRATIDTSAAGFRRTPSYQVQVIGDRLFSGLLVDGPAHVDAPSATGFNIQVVLPSGWSLGSAQTDYVNSADWFALWGLVINQYNNTHGGQGDFLRTATEDSTRINNSLSLCADQLVTIFNGAFQPIGQYALAAADLLNVLSGIAARNNTSVPNLLSNNNISSDRPCISVGQPLTVTPGNLPLNPSRVLTPDFLPQFEKAWHVSWLGVET